MISISCAGSMGSVMRSGKKNDGGIKVDEKELEILIPSKTVRDYVLETGWKFTDFQKASLLCHRGLLLKDEYAHLEALGERTADHALREQITGYLGGIEKGFQAFRENGDRRCIYVLKVREEGDHWDGEYLDSGCFFDWETALACGRKEKTPFEIEKHRVDDTAGTEGGSCSQRANSGIRFDKDGEAVCFWSNEMAGFDNRRFDNAIIEIPNPFQRGDIVTCKGTDGRECFGIVEEEREEWEKRLAQHLQRVQEGDTCIDFYDLFIGVAFLCEDGTFAFSDSTMPLDLERCQPAEVDWTNGSIDTLLVCAKEIYLGKGYLSTLFEVLERYRRSSGK